MKGVQEKESVMGVRGTQKNLSLAITVWHHSASLMMPDSDPQNGFFYLPLTPILDPYITSGIVNLIAPDKRKSAIMLENLPLNMCAQQRFRSACTFG